MADNWRKPRKGNQPDYQPRRQIPTTTNPQEPIDPHQFLDKNGWLTPPPITNPTPLINADNLTPEMELLWADLATASELRNNSKADQTRRSYGAHVKSFIEWCEERGITPLPATPEHTAIHLAHYALAHDEMGLPLRTEDGSPIKRVEFSTVASRLAAINKLHEYAQRPRPGDYEIVAETMAGLGRTFGTRAKSPRLAIELDSLATILNTVDHRTFVALRNTLLVLLRASDVSAGQMVRLTWLDLVPDNETGFVAVTLPAHTQSTRRKTITLRPKRTRGNNLPTPSSLVQQLQAVAPKVANVFVKPDGTTLGRHALMAIAERAASAHDGYRGLPNLTAQEVAGITQEVLLHGSALAIRDKALLTTGWYSALRRSTLVGLNWEDITIDKKARLATLLIRRSKTDQYGQGSTRYLPGVPEDSQDPDPYQHVLLWRAAYAQLAGVAEDELSGPVFPVLTRGGTLRLDRGNNIMRLDGDSVNKIVADYAAQAGLEADDASGSGYGSHSLRVGFVTTALRDDVLTVPEVADVTGHKDMRVLMGYRREANAAKDSPASKLLRKRKQGEEK